MSAARLAGACVRLVGNPHQLSAVEAGGAIRLLTTSAPTAELVTLHHFVDQAEGRATLAVRRGDADAPGGVLPGPHRVGSVNLNAARASSGHIP